MEIFSYAMENRVSNSVEDFNKKVEIVEGSVCSDYIHRGLCIPPKISVSDFMG